MNIITGLAWLARKTREMQVLTAFAVIDISLHCFFIIWLMFSIRDQLAPIEAP